MKKPTPFRVAAQRFAEGRNVKRGACEEISMIVTANDMCSCKEEKFFRYYLSPNSDDIQEYCTPADFWFETFYGIPDDATPDRILALLICEQVWIQEENK